MVSYNWKGTIDEQLTLKYKSGNARELKVTHRNYDLCVSFVIQFICKDGIIWSEMLVPMCMSPVLRMMIRKKPNWNTGKTKVRKGTIFGTIELDFKKYDMRTAKIFLDAIYGCETKDLDYEDLVKLVALVDQYGSDEERD